MIYAEENPSGVKEVDIVVAIPTYHEATSIANVVTQVDAGLSKHFGSFKAAIVVCDNHSMDGTKEVFLSTATQFPKLYLSSAPHEKGKGYNLRNLFERLPSLGPKAVLVMEADIRNVHPDWVYYFIEPVLRGASYVTPLYVYHKYDETLSGMLVYPLLRCLYGRRIRHSIAGDYAFGATLVERFARAEHWSGSVVGKGVDLWTAVTALYARQPICQTIIGAPKLHRMKDPHTQINKTFTQIIEVFLDLMEPFQDFWMKVKWSKPTILFNAELQEAEIPLPVEVNVARLFETFSRGIEVHRDLLSNVLSLPEMHKLEEIRSMGIQHFSFPSHTWATILFDVAVAYRRATREVRQQILEALLPLYYGKIASYVKKTERMSTQQAEEVIEAECMIFEENKGYLVQRWKNS